VQIAIELACKCRSRPEKARPRRDGGLLVRNQRRSELGFPRPNNQDGRTHNLAMLKTLKIHSNVAKDCGKGEIAEPMRWIVVVETSKIGTVLVGRKR